MDVDFNSLPSEVTAEFWKDIPDDVLEEVYRQLEFVFPLSFFLLMGKQQEP